MFVFNRLIADKSTFSELEEILQKYMHTKKERNEINSGNSTKEVKKTVQNFLKGLET
jgi:predicted transcriptional regulator YheO